MKTTTEHEVKTMRQRTRKPTHPGEFFLCEVLEPLNISIKDAAVKLGISRKHLSELCHGKKRLTIDVAAKFAAATNTSIESWYNMQTKLDIWEAEQQDKPEVECFDMTVNEAA
jgi:antitoxin HigA-1